MTANWDQNKAYERWVFTFFNYDIEDEQNIQKLDEQKLKFIIYGHELTSDKQPHLQGYLEFNNKHRYLGVKTLIDPIRGRKSPIHVAPATNDREMNIRYCSKGHQSKEEYETLHESGPNYGLNANVYTRCYKQVREGQGKRNDWTQLYDFINANPDFNSVLKEYPEYAIKYTNGIRSAIDCVKQENNGIRLEERMNKMKLWKWQDKLANELKFQPDERKIIWYADEQGHSGKSLFTKWLYAHNKGNVAFFTNAKTADICHAYNGEKIVIFNFARSNEGRINYGAIEQIKDGLIFSSKYNSNVKINDCPHVICFSNFHPNKSEMSEDRWDIRHISNEDKVFIESAIADSANIEIPEKPIAPSGPSSQVPEPCLAPTEHIGPHLDSNTPTTPPGALCSFEFRQPKPKWLTQLEKLGDKLQEVDEQRIRMWYDKNTIINKSCLAILDNL